MVFHCRKDIFTREKTAQEGKGLVTRKTLDCREWSEDKILVLFVKLLLKDGGGVCHGTSFLISNATVHQFEIIIILNFVAINRSP